MKRIISLILLFILISGLSVSSNGNLEEFLKDEEEAKENWWIYERFLPKLATNIKELGNDWYIFCIYNKKYLYHVVLGGYNRWGIETLIIIGNCEE